MPIERIPSPWDFIGQGLSQGLDSYNQQKDKNYARQQQARMNSIQELGLLNQLGVDSDTMSGKMSASGIPGLQGVPIPKSEAELRRGILGTPGGLDSAPDERLIGAGLPTKDQRSVTQAAGAQARADIASVQQREAAAAHKRLQDALEPIAPGHVAGAAARMGGLTKQNMRQVADTAFQNYMAMRQQSGMPQLGDEASTRSFFDKAAMDLYLEQEKLRISEIGANTGRLTPQDRNMQYLLNFRNQNRMEQQLLTQQYGAMEYVPPSRDGKPDVFAGPRSQMEELKRKEQVIEQAIIDVMAGKNVNIGQIIQSSTAPTPQGGSTPAGSGVTPQTPPQAQGQRKVSPQVLAQIASRIAAMEPSAAEAMIQQNLATGRISPLEASELRAAIRRQK